MKTKLLVLVFAAALLSSCGGGKKESASSGSELTGGKVEFASLVANPGEYIGKEIAIEGKVVHVCKHSGKKLFITGDNPDIMLYIQAGEEMPKFPLELEGTTVVVNGTMSMVEAPQADDPSEHAEHAGGQMIAANADTCSTSQAMAKQVALADMVMVYSNHSVLK